MRERLGWLGSVEWRLIWSRRGTRGKRSIYQLVPLRPPKSGIGCTGWPTPRAASGNAGPDYAKEERSVTGMALPAVASMIGWPTPAERDYRYPNSRTYEDRGGGSKGEQLPNVAAQVVGWTAPQAHDAAPGDVKRWKRHGTKHGDSNLNDEAATIVGWTTPTQDDTRTRKAKYSQGGTGLSLMAGWATPSASDGNGGKGPRKGVSMTGRLPDGSKVTMDLSAQSKLVFGTTGAASDPTPAVSSGALNPAFVSWLMGFPTGWLNCAPSATRLSRRLPRKS